MGVLRFLKIISILITLRISKDCLHEVYRLVLFIYNPDFSREARVKNRVVW